MDGLEEYLGQVTARSKKYLFKEYHLDEFYPTDFELINFYLLDKAINQKQNLFLQINDPKQKTETYRPSFLTIAISLFFKNYCEGDEVEYKSGDILQKGKRTYKFIRINEKGNYLLRLNNATFEISENQIKKYFKVNSKLSNRKVKIGFKHYKNFFNQIFPDIGEELPFQFKYKAAIILDKKSFLRELKNQYFTDIILSKAIPFQWVNKYGKFEKPKVPIDPMIYMGPDYETIKEYVIDEGVQIESVIIIGKNKYKDDDLLKLKQDLRIEEVPFSIIIGSEDIHYENDLFWKWKWTPEEITFLNETEQAEIRSNEIKATDYFTKIKELEALIKEIKTKNSFELPSFAKIKKLFYSLVLPNKEGRIANQIKYIRHLIKKEFTENIKSELLNQNIAPQETTSLFNNKVDKVFISFDNTKLNKIADVNYDFLRV